MNNRKSIPLGDLIDVKHGYAFKGKFFSDEPTQDVVLTPGNFSIGGGFKADKFKYYRGEYPREYILSEGDIIVTMTDLSQEGDTLGFAAKVPEANGLRYLHNQRLGLVVVKNSEVDKEFLYWLLRTSDYHDTIVNAASGSTVKHTSPTSIREYVFDFPGLSEQRIIASVLSSLDDKIGLLQRQNRMLEAMAETLFNQWFSEASMENAKAVRLEDLVTFDPREKLPDVIEPRYFDMKCLSENSMTIADGVRRQVGSGSYFRNTDTLLAKITPCLENGKTGFVMDLDDGEVARGSTEFIVMRPTKGVSPYFIYCLARSSDFRSNAILSMTGTSGRQRVQTGMLKSYEVRYSPHLMQEFHALCEPFFLKVHKNQIQIRTLTRLRDTLLPKLMNGEVRVRY